jgi:hypothetical protein
VLAAVYAASDMKFTKALGSGNLLVGDKVNMSLDISAVEQK